MDLLILHSGCRFAEVVRLLDLFKLAEINASGVCERVHDSTTPARINVLASHLTPQEQHQSEGHRKRGQREEEEQLAHAGCTRVSITSTMLARRFGGGTGIHVELSI